MNGSTDDNAWHADFERFITAFEQMNPFAIDYFYTLLFDSYQDALTQSDGKPMKRKHFENIMEATVKEARLYIAKHELARIEQLTKR